MFQDMSEAIKASEKFMINIFILLLSMKGRVNFANMSRIGTCSEKKTAPSFRKVFRFFRVQQISDQKNILLPRYHCRRLRLHPQKRKANSQHGRTLLERLHLVSLTRLGNKRLGRRRRREKHGDAARTRTDFERFGR